MSIIAYRGVLPQVDPSAFIADGVQLIGNVRVARNSSIWFNSVLRGDINTVEIGERTNIQDCSVLHVTSEFGVRVGNDVTVGHRAIVHGCTIEDGCLIGMGSVILDNARIGKHSLIAAGAVVLQNYVVPEGMLAAGVPAKIIRQLTQQEIDQIHTSAQRYVDYAGGYKA